METYKLPLGTYGEAAIDLVIAHFQPLVDGFKALAGGLNASITAVLVFAPPPVVIAAIVAIAWYVRGRAAAIFAALGLLLLWNLGLWAATMATLSLVLTATLLALLIGVPLGIAMAESRAVRFVLVPVLDFLQTMPRFVYLIPAVVLLGIGTGPAIFATLTLATPPPVRLTAVGLMQVDPRMIEAAQAFGSSRRQILIKIKLPLALPTIMLGVNQCLMMALNMVVIASLIGAEGLGKEILNGIALLRPGEGMVAGLGVFVLAVLIDRITRGWSDRISAGRDGGS